MSLILEQLDAARADPETAVDLITAVPKFPLLKCPRGIPKPRRHVKSRRRNHMFQDLILYLVST